MASLRRVTPTELFASGFLDGRLKLPWLALTCYWSTKFWSGCAREFAFFDARYPCCLLTKDSSCPSMMSKSSFGSRVFFFLKLGEAFEDLTNEVLFERLFGAGSRYCECYC